METQTSTTLDDKVGKREWKTFPGAPTNWSGPRYIKPLFRLGELTTPTTFSASSPDRHGSDISEMRPVFVKTDYMPVVSCGPQISELQQDSYDANLRYNRRRVA